MKVKICGLTNPEDARHAARCGADYIGMIFAKRSKRLVSASQAQEIAHAATLEGAQPIGVFADETKDEILALCEHAHITTIQLHGQGSKKLLPVLKEHFQTIIYAFKVELDGTVSQSISLPNTVHPLYDCLNGGTGTAFDWGTFVPPTNAPWFLAGGLNPQNITAAIRLLMPYGVDVASGVEIPNTCRKDPLLVEAFIQAAKKEML